MTFRRYLLQHLAALFALQCITQSVIAATVTTLAPPQGRLDGLSVDSEGAIYVSQIPNNRVLRIDDNGVTPFVTDLNFPLGSTFDSDGNFYVSSSNRIVRRTPDGTISTYATGFSLAAGMVFKSNGVLLVADYNLSRISEIAIDGTVTTLISGNGINGPAGIALDANETIYVGNFNDGNIIRIDADGNNPSIIAKPSNLIGYLTFSNNTIYATLGDLNRVVSVSTDGVITPLAGTGAVGSRDGEASQAQFNTTNGITVSNDGKIVYVSEANDQGSVRAIELDNTGSDFQINQGVSGTWFFPDTSGSGLLVDIEPTSTFFFAAWFTYTRESENQPGETRWFTASGNYTDNTATLTLFESSGGVFDQTNSVTTVAVGSMTIEFDSCNMGMVNYNFDSGPSGSFPIQRGIPNSEILCETLEGM